MSHEQQQQQPDPSGAFIPDAAGGADGAPSGLLGVGEELESGKRQTIPTSILLLALVMAIAGGVLYGMRQIGLGVGLDLVLPAIDYPLDVSAPQDPRDEKHLEIIATLRSSEAIDQVPLDDLQRNPFKLESNTATEVTMAEEDPAVIAERQRAQRRQEIQMTLEALEVNSIITGSVPLARINGRAVRVGDVIADMFRVRAIHGRMVELEADGVIYTKSLGN